MITWELVVVSLEIVAVFAAAALLVRRRGGRDQLMLSTGRVSTASASGSAKVAGFARSPLMHPAACWSLRSLRAYRIAATVFFVVGEILEFVQTKIHCLVMYTSWNFVLQGTYFAIAAYRTHQVYVQTTTEQGISEMHAALMEQEEGSPRASTATATGRRRGWPRLELVLDLCLATSLVIAVIVWTILYPIAVKNGTTDLLRNGVSYCQHGINVIVLLVDFCASRHAVSSDTWALMLLWPAIYCLFTWIVHVASPSGYWPYPFLKLDTPLAPVWYAGLVAVHLIAFAGVCWISRRKEAWQRRGCVDSGLDYAEHHDGDEAQAKVFGERVV